MKRTIRQHSSKVSNIDIVTIVNKNEIDNANKRIILVPKWSIYIFSLFLILLFVVMIAAYVILIGAPRPGLFLESCFQRSCSKPNNLKCIDGLCQCKPNEYYTNKCMSKKNLLEKCQRDNQCYTGYCNSGQCECAHKTSECKSYNEKCSSISECIASKMLTCINSKCQCDDSRYWDGDVCVYKRLLYERCSNFEYCDSTQNLTCSNNTCRCFYETHYEDADAMICEPRTGYNSDCNISSTCYTYLTCSLKRCLCPSNYAFRVDLNACVYCGSGNFGLDERCYSYHSSLTWFDANDNCQAYGRWLATPKNNRTVQIFNALYPNTRIWMGFYRDNFTCASNPPWISVSATPWGNNNQLFCPRQPDCAGSSEFCVEILKQPCFNDAKCSFLLNSLCEFIPDPT